MIVYYDNKLCCVVCMLYILITFHCHFYADACNFPFMTVCVLINFAYSIIIISIVKLMLL